MFYFEQAETTEAKYGCNMLPHKALDESQHLMTEAPEIPDLLTQVHECYKGFQGVEQEFSLQ
jgi:hypothetical protein